VGQKEIRGKREREGDGQTLYFEREKETYRERRRERERRKERERKREIKEE
jgi:hypothetical protein